MRKVHHVQPSDEDNVRLVECSKIIDDDDVTAQNGGENALQSLLGDFEQHLMGMSGGTDEATSGTEHWRQCSPNYTRPHGK